MVGIPKVTEDDIESLLCLIEDAVDDSVSEGAVIGISGGLDSAVVSQLCADALGGDRVLNIFMPTDSTPEDDRRIAREFSETICARYVEIPIQGIVDSFAEAVGTDDRLELGNIAARVRMTILFSYAKRERRLVVGTSNKSEYMMGYFTKFGDGACDVSPIKGFYKTQIREMAGMLGVSEEIISKPPSAGLWKGQTDEDDMGVTYDKLDTVLYGIEKGIADDHIASASEVDMMMIAMIRDQVAATAHKRRPALSL